MKKNYYILFVVLSIFLYSCVNDITKQNKFIHVQGQDLIDSFGEKFYIKGTNLGNWLNPEGYMFGFRKTNSPRFINEMLCQLVGPDYTAEFWKQFKDNYITYKDIQFIKSTGSNTIRLPFHYKLFTDEDYMGLTHNQDGFARIDSVVKWCKQENLYIILDMHDAPGGQTGDNIDDSYGYPWLFESEASQQLFCSIWKDIAKYYKDEPIILGYDLLNEPIAPYFENMEELNSKLEDVYKQAVAAIREVDKNHIIILGGAQWNSNFSPFIDWEFDDNIMYSCHRYGGEPITAAIRGFIEFQQKTNLPMYMGEIGHNTSEWMAAFCLTMEDNNIGWTFWPYKKVDASSFVGIVRPEQWQKIINFAEGSRTTYKEIRELRFNQIEAKQILNEFIQASRFENCLIQTEYIQALGLNVE